MVEIDTIEDQFWGLLDGTIDADDLTLTAILSLVEPLHIYLPRPSVSSSLSTSYMRAFVEVQVQVNRLASLVRSGDPNASRLTAQLKQELELSVVVTDGSTNIKLDLTKVLLKALGKVTGKQLMLTILALAILVASGLGASAYLEVQKAIKLEEIKSADHRAALDALKFATSQDMAKFDRLVDALETNVEFGREALAVVQSTYQEVLRAASSSDIVEINGVQISGATADLLTLSTKTPSEAALQLLEARVVDINTEDPLQPAVQLVDVRSGQHYRFAMENSLFAADDRAALFRSLETGATILVELEVTVANGEVRSTEFLRVQPD